MCCKVFLGSRKSRLTTPWKRQVPSFLSFAFAACLLLLGQTSFAAEPSKDGWKQFLNGGDCVVDAELPIHWSADGAGIAWQAELPGYGQSSPVSEGTHVLITTTSGQNKEAFHVTCLLLATGEKVWQADFVNPSPEENTSYVSRAAPTPVLDDRAVYVANEGGVLASLDLQGKVLWQRDLVAEYGPIKARHGLASSLAHDEKHLFVWVERSEQPYVLAVDKASGETAWKVEGLGATSWSSPQMINVGEGQHLVCSASGKIVGLSPANGEKLWELTEISNNTSCTPIPVGDGRFFIGASDGRGEENAGKGAASNGLIKVSKGDDGKFDAQFVWRAEKASCTFGSPMVAGDSVWIVNRAGALYQLDLETGKQISVARIKAGGIWATPLAAADKLYFFGQKGVTSVYSLQDSKEIASNSLWEVTEETPGQPSLSSHVQYAAAAVNDTLLIRRGDRLYAVRQ